VDDPTSVTTVTSGYNNSLKTGKLSPFTSFESVIVARCDRGDVVKRGMPSEKAHQRALGLGSISRPSQNNLIDHTNFSVKVHNLRSESLNLWQSYLNTA